MKKFKLVGWEALTQDDDGRPNGRIGVFKYEECAKRAAEGQGAWGSNGTVRFIDQDVIIYDSYYEMKDQKSHDKAKEVFNNLSKSEQDALRAFLSN